jgi:hypothetical protein
MISSCLSVVVPVGPFQNEELIEKAIKAKTQANKNKSLMNKVFAPSDTGGQKSARTI